MDLIKNLTPTIGFVASSFDLLHPGHCLMLEDAKNHCDFLIAALQEDPTIDRPEKNKPIMSIVERYIVLSAIKFVDKIVCYRTEEQLDVLLQIINPDVRILGDDYIGKEDKITGRKYCKELYFHKRSAHKWSTTYFRNKLKNS
jgi:glycerol-3-phosphate cytidylyltransferase